jgi:hypothetical protein
MVVEVMEKCGEMRGYVPVTSGGEGVFDISLIILLLNLNSQLFCERVHFPRNHIAN